MIKQSRDPGYFPWTVIPVLRFSQYRDYDPQNLVFIIIRFHIVTNKFFNLILDFDEWTLNENCRYLNVNSHIKNRFWNLRLIRLYGLSPAETCIKLLEE